jgi:DNA-binding CsgD family transcriptional regulator
LERKYEAFERKYSLSAREREVFRFVVQGYSNLEISTSLYISESTVKYHVGNIFKKTACSNRTDLAVMFRDS